MVAIAFKGENFEFLADDDIKSPAKDIRTCVFDGSYWKLYRDGNNTIFVIIPVIGGVVVVKIRINVRNKSGLPSEWDVEIKRKSSGAKIPKASSVRYCILAFFLLFNF